MCIYKEYKSKLIAALEELRIEEGWGSQISFDKITVEPCKNPSHGDISTNAAMVISSQLKVYSY